MVISNSYGYVELPEGNFLGIIVDLGIIMGEQIDFPMGNTTLL